MLKTASMLQRDPVWNYFGRRRQSIGLRWPNTRCLPFRAQRAGPLRRSPHTSLVGHRSGPVEGAAVLFRVPPMQSIPRLTSWRSPVRGRWLCADRHRLAVLDLLVPLPLAA